MYFMQYTRDIIKTFKFTKHQNNEITEAFFTLKRLFPQLY